MKIKDIEFVDAVIGIPKNCVHIMLTAETFENGEAYTVKGEFSPSDVRDAINRFEATLAGDYPEYALTEEGKEYADKLLTFMRERM